MNAMKAMKAMRVDDTTGVQFDRFTRGRIIGLAEGGAKPSVIARKITKSDNTHPKPDAVRKTIRKWKAMKSWRGQREEGSGRPPRLSDKQREKITDLVFEYRGNELVKISFLKNMYPALRLVSDQTVSRALHESGLAWLRRRVKRLVPSKHKARRISFARWLRRQPDDVVEGFAFVDGTSYYLAVCDTQAEDKERGRLGKYVWRDSTGRDGLFTENVGPSLYAAKQGKPVKVWGLLCNGHLCIDILPEDASTKSGTAHMNQDRYQTMVTKLGKKWLRACHAGKLPHKVSLIQDHEKCLWAAPSVACLEANHLYPLDTAPTSPDLNVIEGIWALLRKDLITDAPVGIESRTHFIQRLRVAVRRLNRDRDALLSMCHSLKERAQDVLNGRGAMTKW